MNLQKLHDVTKTQRVNKSEAREVIYHILAQRDNVVSVVDLLKYIAKNYTKKISQNTLYRHLNFFSENGLVIVLQDRLKRAYYYINDDECPCFRICTKCTTIEKVVKPESFDKPFGNCDYVTIHQKCKSCEGELS